MKSGFETLRAIFDAITIYNLTTKREIAEKIGLSTVSVSKATNVLLEAGIISEAGSISSGGRRSKALSPAYSNKYLVVDLSEKPFSYAIAYLGEELSSMGAFYPSVKYVPYLRDLDFGENVGILAKNIVSKGASVTASAVILPDIQNLPADYLGDDIYGIFSRHNIFPEIMTSKKDAVTAFPLIKNTVLPCLYVSISDSVRGIYCGDITFELNWNGVRIDSMAFSDILKCSLDAKSLAVKTEKLLSLVADIFSACSVMLDTHSLPSETVDILLDRMEALEDVTFSAPALSGLLSLLADNEIKKIKDKR